MNALLHLVATAIVAPYAALALAFLIVGRVAASKGLWAILDTVVTIASWVIPWGVLAFVLLFAAIGAMGFFAQTRLAAAAALLALGAASLGVLLFYGAGSIGIDEAVFLSPCVAAAIGCAWQLQRA